MHDEIIHDDRKNVEGVLSVTIAGTDITVDVAFSRRVDDDPHRETVVINDSLVLDDADLRDKLLGQAG